MPNKREQDDDRYRDSQEPKQNSATHNFPPLSVLKLGQPAGLLTSMKRVRKRANGEEMTHDSEQNTILHRVAPLSPK
jgi:hypothetical protein